MELKSTAVMPRLALLVGLSLPRAADALDTTLGFRNSYRTDKLNWSIANSPDGATPPNILSELTWDRVHSIGAGLDWVLTQQNGIQLRASVDYGLVMNGRNQDSDYFGNDRTLEFSRSNNESLGDGVWDASVAAGLHYRINETLLWVPLVGWSYHVQKLRINEGNQTIPPAGPFAGLNSTYRTRWNGPWVGTEFLTPISDATEAFMRVEYHWARYYAEADWNLRADFAHPRSFEHRANAAGSGFTVGARFRLPERWVARLAFDYREWATGRGVDRVFFADGGTASTRLNEVEWTSRAFSVGVERLF